MLINKIFLGGTCNNSSWREELIPLLECDYFDPVVEEWTLECQENEIEERDNKCNIHLYVITSQMIGCYSIAEVIDSVHNKLKKTLFFVITDGFKAHELKSLKAVLSLVKLRGGRGSFESNVKNIANKINEVLN